MVSCDYKLARSRLGAVLGAKAPATTQLLVSPGSRWCCHGMTMRSTACGSASLKSRRMRKRSWARRVFIPLQQSRDPWQTETTTSLAGHEVFTIRITSAQYHCATSCRLPALTQVLIVPSAARTPLLLSTSLLLFAFKSPSNVPTSRSDRMMRQFEKHVHNAVVSIYLSSHVCVSSFSPS
jgi:hypothetical protein